MQIRMTAIAIRGVETSSDIVLKGKTVGHRFSIGCGPISVARKAYRAAGYTAREASAKIAEDLEGGQGNLAWAQAQSCLETARAKNMFPTAFEIRDGSFCMRGAAAPEAKDSKTDRAVKDAVAASQEKVLAVLVSKLGCTREEALALL